jgi:PhzF family phenazine biosynthesis protein
MKQKVYKVDAFTDRTFGGNPAAVCVMDQWLNDNLMQRLAMENNLSETAFIVKEGNDYRIRWFTPTAEVKLCGHATLASAWVFYNVLGYAQKEIGFQSLSGRLTVTREDDGRLTLNFPANMPVAVEHPDPNVFEGLGIAPAPVFMSSFDMMVVLPDEATVEGLSPNFNTLAKVAARGVIVTARGTATDIASRCFYPQTGINEDPVTGSAHTITVPYWAKTLGKNELKAVQLSARRGYLDCQLVGDRVLMSGRAVLFLEGEMIIPEDEL